MLMGKVMETGLPSAGVTPGSTVIGSVMATGSPMSGVIGRVMAIGSPMSGVIGKVMETGVPLVATGVAVIKDATSVRAGVGARRAAPISLSAAAASASRAAVGIAVAGGRVSGTESTVVVASCADVALMGALRAVATADSASIGSVVVGSASMDSAFDNWASDNSASGAAAAGVSTSAMSDTADKATDCAAETADSDGVATSGTEAETGRDAATALSVEPSGEPTVGDAVGEKEAESWANATAWAASAVASAQNRAVRLRSPRMANARSMTSATLLKAISASSQMRQGRRCKGGVDGDSVTMIHPVRTGRLRQRVL